MKEIRERLVGKRWREGKNKRPNEGETEGKTGTRENQKEVWMKEKQKRKRISVDFERMYEWEMGRD